MKNRVYNGVRATGYLHLGNYLGSVKGMLSLQDKYDCIFSVVDLHAMTTPYDKDRLKASVRSVVLDYLAAGIDPEKARIEIQSQIPQHTELAYLLSTIYPLAPLQDLPTFKDKAAQFPKHITTALLYYPILMAADIFLYKGELIPVGLDQEPHLELAREIARKFNRQYGETFPEPKRFEREGAYVPSLLGKGKMSKTVEGSYIALTDDLETISKKIAKVPTDSGKGRITEFQKEPLSLEKIKRYENEHSEMQIGVAALMEFVELVQGKHRREEYEQQYQNAGIRYSDLKKELTEAIYTMLHPIQEKRKYFEAHPEIVDQIIADGRERCLVIAQETIGEVKEKMGLPLA